MYSLLSSLFSTHILSEGGNPSKAASSQETRSVQFRKADRPLLTVVAQPFFPRPADNLTKLFVWNINWILDLPALAQKVHGQTMNICMDRYVFVRKIDIHRKCAASYFFLLKLLANGNLSFSIPRWKHAIMFLQQEKNSIFQQHQSFASVHDVCPLQTTKRLDENTTCNWLGNKNSNSYRNLSFSITRWKHAIIPPHRKKRILFSSNIKVLLLYMTFALYKLQTD